MYLYLQSASRHGTTSGPVMPHGVGEGGKERVVMELVLTRTKPTSAK